MSSTRRISTMASLMAGLEPTRIHRFHTIALFLLLNASAATVHCTHSICFPRSPQGFSLSSGVPSRDFYRNFYSVRAVTVVIFGHLNRSVCALSDGGGLGRSTESARLENAVSKYRGGKCRTGYFSSNSSGGLMRSFWGRGFGSQVRAVGLTLCISTLGCTVGGQGKCCMFSYLWEYAVHHHHRRRRSHHIGAGKT